MYLREVNMSCGVRELFSLSLFGIAVEQTLGAAIRQHIKDNGRDYAIIQFSDIVMADGTPSRPDTSRLLAFIEDNDLGRVAVSDTVINPNTTHRIAIFTWYLNRKAKMWNKLVKG